MTRLIVLSLIASVLSMQAASDAFQAKAKKDPARAPNYGKYDFSYTTLDGKSLRLSEHGGKVVLVNIWAPWCGPCKLEMPGFVNVYKQYRDRGFELLSVAISTNESDVRAFVKKYGVTWPVGIKDEVGRQYKAYGIPDSYLFNPDGSVANHFVGYTTEATLNTAINEALGKFRKSN